MNAFIAPYHTSIRGPLYFLAFHYLSIWSIYFVCLLYLSTYLIYLFIYGSAVLLLGLGRFSVSYSYTQSAKLLGWGISPSQGRYLTQMRSKRTQKSIPWMGFESTIPTFERAKTVHDLDRAATAIGLNFTTLAICNLYKLQSPSLCRLLHFPFRTNLYFSDLNICLRFTGKKNNLRQLIPVQI
jgi:hypothetical protein